MGRKSKDQIIAEKDTAKFSINYADKESVASRALEFWNQTGLNAKRDRKAKEEEWLEDLRLWTCQNSDVQMYAGRSNLIIPELLNQVETSVGQFLSGLFPTDDYIGIIPVKDTDEDEAEQIRDAVKHELDHKNNLRLKAESFQRQKVLYGTAFFKPVFEKTMKTIWVKNPKGFAEMKQVPKYQGVKVNVMDTFHTYVWPETANSMEETIMAFDENFIEKHELEKSKLYKNLEKLTNIPQDYQDYGWVDTIRLTMNNLSSAATHRPSGVLVSEAWADFDIVPGERVPCIITIGNYNTVIRVQRNPFWHQLKPYLMGRYRKGPAGEAYGHSLPEIMRSLQYMMTDIGNQTMDSLTYSLNPIALIDPGYAGDVNSFKMQPGARWFASPQGVDFKTFPDISVAGFQGMQQVRAMIQQFSDNAPSVAPQLSGKVRSATQASAVQNEISQNQRNMILSDELEVMGPLCFMTHELLKQFMPEEYQIATQGPEKGQWITKTVNPETLQKDALFVWRGSEVAQASALRTQQLISAYNMAIQASQLSPGEIDLTAFFKIIMDEGFELKDLNIFIKDREKKTVDPDIENMSLCEGEDCPVNPGDDYQKHMTSHKDSYNNCDSDLGKLMHLKHMERHDLQKKAHDIIMQQKAQIAALQQQTQGQPPPRPGPPGNQAQAPSSISQMQQGMRAVEPNQPGGGLY